MTLYLFTIIAAIVSYALTARIILKDKRKGTLKDSVSDYFITPDEAVLPGRIFSVLLPLVLIWTFIKIFIEAFVIVWHWIN